jgi:general stress protein YciG
MNEHDTTMHTATNDSQKTANANANPNPMAATTADASASPQSPTAPRPKQRRGFAAMDPRLVAEIASKGGKAAHAAGTAHEFTADEARQAGRKGGLAPHQRRRPGSQPPQSPPAT